MDIARTTSTRTTFMWNLQIHFSIWLHEKILKPTIGTRHSGIPAPLSHYHPLVYCQPEGESWENYWWVFIRHCQCQQLKQKSLLFQAVTVAAGGHLHLHRHVCIAAPLLRLVICIAPLKASCSRRATGSFAKGCDPHQTEGSPKKISQISELPTIFEISDEKHNLNEKG